MVSRDVAVAFYQLGPGRKYLMAVKSTLAVSTSDSIGFGF